MFVRIVDMNGTKTMNDYHNARRNMIDRLESVKILIEDTIKRAKHSTDLDDLDCRIMGLHEQLHAVSYILGAASAILNIEKKSKKFSR